MNESYLIEEEIASMESKIASEQLRITHVMDNIELQQRHLNFLREELETSKTRDY